MPITIEPPLTPGGALSPGQNIGWRSDFVGPLPVGSALSVVVSIDSEGTQPLGQVAIQTQITHGSYILFDQSQNSWLNGTFALATGQTVFLVSQLKQGTAQTVVDSGTTSFQWQPSSDVGLNIRTTGGSTGGGLTAEQAVQLQETHDQSFLNISLDTLTTVDLTPGGPSPGPVNAQLPGYTFGVIVRLANIPADLLPQTPDEAYWVPTLATVRLFRGSDLWLRVPIHTPSKIIPFAATDLAVALATATVGQWILNLTIQVNFLPGVTGRVLLMKTP